MNFSLILIIYKFISKSLHKKGATSMIDKEYEIEVRLSTKHKLPRSLLKQLTKQSKLNQYERREESKKLHELESLIQIQINDERKEI